MVAQSAGNFGASIFYSSDTEADCNESYGQSSFKCIVILKVNESQKLIIITY